MSERLGLTILATIVLAGGAAAQPPVQPRVDALGDPLPKPALYRIGTTRLHMGEGVGAIAAMPDGKSVAAIGSYAILFWNSTTGHLERRFTGDFTYGERLLLVTPDTKTLALNHGGNFATLDIASGDVRKLTEFMPADSAAFAIDGKTVTAVFHGGGSPIIRRWETATGKVRSEWTCAFDLARPVKLEGKPEDQRITVALSRDGQVAAVCQFDRATKQQGLRIHDAITGDERRRWLLPVAEVTHLTLSPDAGHVAARSADGTMAVWQVTDGKELSRWKADAGFTWDRIGFAPDGESLFWEGAAGTMRWDWRNAKVVQTYRGTLGAPVFFAGTNRIAIRGRHDTVRLLDAETGKDLCLLHRPGDTIAFSPDGRLVVWSEREEVVLGDAGTGAEIRRWHAHHSTRRNGHDWGVGPIIFSKDGKMLATCGADGRIRLWHVPSGKPIRTIEAKAEMTWLWFAAEGRLVSGHYGDFLSGSGGEVCLWDWQTGAALGRWSGDQSVTIAPDLKTIARAESKPGLLRLTDVATGKAGHTLSDVREWVRYGYSRPDTGSVGVGTVFRPRFSPDGRWLATGGKNLDPDGDEALYLWDAATGKRVASLGGGKFILSPATFSPDGRLLVLMNRQCQLCLVRSADGQVQRTCGQFKDALAAARFTPDGRTLLTAVHGEFAISEVATGGLIARRDGHGKDIWRLVGSPDGRRLATQSYDGTILVWDIERLFPAAKLPKSSETSEVLALWNELESADAVRGRQAIEALIAAAEQTVPFLRPRLKVVPPVDTKKLAAWVAALGSDDFASRQDAETHLERLEEVAGPALRDGLAAKPSLEAKRRIERLLVRLAEPAVLSGKPLQIVRAVQVLEGIGNGDANQLLDDLARGAAGARITEEAAAALRRRSHP